jgi:hypothetical protein
MWLFRPFKTAKSSKRYTPFNVQTSPVFACSNVDATRSSIDQRVMGSGFDSSLMKLLGFFRAPCLSRWHSRSLASLKNLCLSLMAAFWAKYGVAKERCCLDPSKGSSHNGNWLNGMQHAGKHRDRGASIVSPYKTVENIRCAYKVFRK